MRQKEVLFMFQKEVSSMFQKEVSSIFYLRPRRHSQIDKGQRVLLAS